ncbi:TIGR03943 family putative permease subunit [Paenibacillus sepulcri]|uniref:TIGR03943 family protein n=1 Tax=Paenibacillus sepulcri TaxID=359917 RepID=A0ABS7C0C8_9BACL|nr:TIGR03943 family protein [Paenibacillus sepulcri]
MKYQWNLLHHGLKALIMTGFSALILYLVFTGNILLYIAPHLIIYVDIASVGLLIMAGFQWYLTVMSIRNPAAACDCGHDHDHDGHTHEPPRSLLKNVIIYGLFVLPLVFGGLLPNTALAGSLAKNKGMNLGGGGAAAAGGAPAELVELDGDADPALKQLFKTDVYNKDYAKLGILLYQQDVIEMKDEWFIEKLQAMNTFVDNFQDRTITISGFVYRQKGLAGNQFIVGRMAMTHCIADISPYGIIAESADAAKYKDDSWISITGTIGQTVFDGLKVIKINIDSIKPAAAPEVPYVYPDWDFASKI